MLVCEDPKMSTMPSGRWRHGGRRRDRDAQEQLRLKAGGLFARQVPQAEIARELGTRAKNVSRWYRRWQQDGDQALRSRGAPGRTPEVSREQLAEVEQALLAGARVNGFPTDLWTLPRVAQVVERLTGVAHGHTHDRRHTAKHTITRPWARAHSHFSREAALE